MAIENGDTVLKVYTSNTPPGDASDEAQYVKRAGRAHTQRISTGRTARLRAALDGARRRVRPAPLGEGADAAARTASDRRRRRAVGASGRRSAARRAVARQALAVCAVLLGVVSIKALPYDWAQQATAAMSSAVNMSVDLDRTLGQLQFVREVIPASAMAFLIGERGYSAPFTGEITHEYTAEQPWLEYLGDSQAVNCVRAGEVVQLEQGAAGDWAVRVSHGDGLESIYAFLSEVSVSQGDSVSGAQQLGRADGTSGARIYFEMRLDGEPVDPMDYIGEA